MFLNGFDDVLDFKSDALGFDGELLHFALQQVLALACARRGNFADHRPNAWAHFQPAFLNEVLHHFVCCVRMDFELGCQCTNGRERLSRSELTAYKRLLHGEYELIENRFPASEG